MSDDDFEELLAEFGWLYRGMPVESPEVLEVEAFGEVTPSRPDRTGERWHQLHMAGETKTAYTSWTTDRSLAEDAASTISDEEDLSGRIRIVRVGRTSCSVKLKPQEFVR